MATSSSFNNRSRRGSLPGTKAPFLQKGIMQTIVVYYVFLFFCGLVCGTLAANDNAAAADVDESSSSSSSSSSPSFRVAAYLPDYRSYINVNQTAPFLTDLFLFSFAPKPQQVSGDGNDENSKKPSVCCLEERHYEIANQAKAYKEEQARRTSAGGAAESSKLKVWLTVGGAGRSDDFLAKPDLLMQAIRGLAARYHLDGVDLDCEAFRHRRDFDQYIQWIEQHAAPVFHKGGLLVSVALHPGQFLSVHAYQAIDYVHLMTYDMMTGPGKYHADVKTVSIAVRKLIETGCPPEKILLGLPAYARHVQRPGAVKTYAELVDDMERKNGGEISANNLDVFDGLDGYIGDSPKSMRTKVEYARQKGLGGVFLWELGQDKQHDKAPGGVLLEAVSVGRVYTEEHDEL